MSQTEANVELEVERLRARLEPGSADAWLDTLLQHERAFGDGFGDVAWLLASLAGDAHLALLTEATPDLWPRVGSLPLEVLRRNGSDAALRGLARVHHEAWHRRLGQEALDRLLAVAEERGRDLWELLREVTGELPLEQLPGGIVLPLTADRERPLVAEIAAVGPLPGVAFRHALRDLGYRALEVEDAGLVYRHAKHVRGYLLVLSCNGLPAGGPCYEPVELEDMKVVDVRQRDVELSWPQVPARLLSLALTDLRLLASRC
jgi:hypothetical protein